MLLFALLLSLGLCAALAFQLGRCRRLIRLSQSHHDAARMAEGNVTRALQLLAHELQSLALGLRGHVDRLSREGSASAGSLAALVAQLDHVAGEMAGQLTMEGQPRHLSFEVLPLAPLVAEAVLAMQAAIAPGRRHVRVAAPDAEPVAIWADRRAMRLVLARVLGEAVRSSAQDDWIEIGWSAGAAGLVLHIADEGHGAIWPGLDPGPRDSRGIGLRLSLARALVESHGGTLAVEAQARVGTRVVICLPEDALRLSSPDGIVGGQGQAHIAAE